MTVPLYDTMSNLTRQINEFHGNPVTHACYRVAKGDNTCLKILIANTDDSLLKEGVIDPLCRLIEETSKWNWTYLCSSLADLIPDPPPIDERAEKYIDELWRLSRVRDIAIKALGLTVAKQSDCNLREEIMGKLLEWANTGDVAVKALGIAAVKTDDMALREKIVRQLLEWANTRDVAVKALGYVAAKTNDSVLVGKLLEWANTRDVAVKALGYVAVKTNDSVLVETLLEWANTRDVAVQALGYVAAKTTDLHIRGKLLNTLWQLDPRKVFTITTLGFFVAKIQDPTMRTEFMGKIARYIQYHDYKVVADVIEIIVNKTKDLDFRKDFVNNLYGWAQNNWHSCSKHLLCGVALGMIASKTKDPEFRRELINRLWKEMQLEQPSEVQSIINSELVKFIFCNARGINLREEDVSVTFERPSKIRGIAIGLGFIICHARDINLRKEVAVALWNVAGTKDVALEALGFVAVQTTDSAYRKKLLDYPWDMIEINPHVIRNALRFALIHTNSSDLTRELINKLQHLGVSYYEIYRMVLVSICHEENFGAIEILVELCEENPREGGRVLAKLAMISDPDIREPIISAIGRLSLKAQEIVLRCITERHELLCLLSSRIKILSDFGKESPYGVVRVLAYWAMDAYNPNTRKIVMDTIQLNDAPLQKAAFDHIVALLTPDNVSSFVNIFKICPSAFAIEAVKKVAIREIECLSNAFRSTGLRVLTKLVLWSMHQQTDAKIAQNVLMALEEACVVIKWKYETFAVDCQELHPKHYFALIEVLGILANKTKHVELKHGIEDMLVQLSNGDHEEEVIRIARNVLVKMAETRLLRIFPSHHKKRALSYLL